MGTLLSQNARLGIYIPPEHCAQAIWVRAHGRMHAQQHVVRARCVHHCIHVIQCMQRVARTAAARVGVMLLMACTHSNDTCYCATQYTTHCNATKRMVCPSYGPIWWRHGALHNYVHGAAQYTTHCNATKRMVCPSYGPSGGVTVHCTTTYCIYGTLHVHRQLLLIATSVHCCVRYAYSVGCTEGSTCILSCATSAVCCTLLRAPSTSSVLCILSCAPLVS